MNQKLAIKQFHSLKKYSDKTTMRLAGEAWNSNWKTLIAIMLSAQTREETTIEVCKELFKKYKTAKLLGEGKLSDIEKTIHSVNYNKTKAKNIKITAQMISRGVPKTLQKLTELPGVGIKTANVYLTEIHNADAIGVDTHVYRIARKLGWAKSKYHTKVGEEIMALFPKRLWKEINPTLVRFGKEYGRSSRQENEILDKVSKQKT